MSIISSINFVYSKEFPGQRAARCSVHVIEEKSRNCRKTLNLGIKKMTFTGLFIRFGLFPGVVFEYLNKKAMEKTHNAATKYRPDSSRRWLRPDFSRHIITGPAMTLNIPI